MKLYVNFYVLLVISLFGNIYVSAVKRRSGEILKSLDRIEFLRAKVQEHPDSYDYQASFALALQKHEREFKQGGFFKRQAIAAYKKAIELRELTLSETTSVGKLRTEYVKDYYLLRLSVATLYKELGEPLEAITVLRKLDNAMVDEETRYRALIELSELYRSLSMYPLAVETLVKALSLDFEITAHASYLLTSFQMEEFNTLRPKGSKSWLQYVEKIETSVQNELNRHYRSHMTAMKLYALFNAYDFLARVGPDYQNFYRHLAWQRLQLGSTIMSEILHEETTLEETEKNFAILKDIFTSNTLKASQPSDGRNIIFIVGIPRSGSTLVEQILHSHSLVVGLGEDSVFNNELDAFRTKLLQILALNDLEKLQSFLDQESERMLRECINSPYNQENSSIVVDKMLFNFANIGFIHMLFPKAKVVHTFKKDTLDAMFSLYKKQFMLETATWSYSWSSIKRYIHLYKDLMAHWDSVFPNFVLAFPYEDLVEDPRRMARNLLQFCDLPWEESILDFTSSKNKRSVQTHSSNQITRPIYNSAIGAWKFYEEFISEESSLPSSEKEL